jgi:hypothetical protein
MKLFSSKLKELATNFTVSTSTPLSRSHFRSRTAGWYTDEMVWILCQVRDIDDGDKDDP